MNQYLKLGIYILINGFVFALNGQTRGNIVSAQEKKEKAALYYYRGAIAGSQEEPRSAYYLYKYAYKLDPQDSNIAYALGLQYMQRQDVDNALALLGQAYAQDSTNRDIMQGYTTVLANTSDKARAIGILERWVDKNPNDEEVIQYLASLYFRASDYQKAIDLYGKIKQENKSIFGEYLRLTLIRARLYQALNQNDKALVEFDDLIKTFPNESYAKVRVLRALYDAEAYSDAQRYLAMVEQDSAISNSELISLQIPYYQGISDSLRWEKALRMELEDSNGIAEQKFEHWQTYLHNKSVGDTLPESYNWVFERIIELHPEATSVQLSYAKALKLQTKTERAIDLLLGLTKTMPEDSEVWSELMSLLVETERYKELEELSPKAREYHPNEWKLVYLASATYIMQNRITEGRKYLEQVLPQLEEQEADDYGLSILYAMLGDLYEEHNRKRCYAYYDKALAYNANNAEVLNNYAYFLALEGKDLAQAESMASRGLNVNKDDHNLLDTYAWILHLRGKHSLAELYITKAIDEAGEELAGVHLDHYGDILQAQGKSDEARKQWIEALTLYKKELIKKKAEKASAKSRRELQDKIKRIEKLLK